MTLTTALRRSAPRLVATLFALAPPATAGTLEVLDGSAAIGQKGLKVTLGIVCVTDDVVAPTPTVNTDQLACDTITAANTQVVAPGATFTSGGPTILGDGFSVAAGATFAVVNDLFVAGPYAYVEDGSPSSEPVYKAQFKLTTNNLNMTVGEEIQLFTGYQSGGLEVFRLILRGTPAGAALVLEARDGGGTTTHPSPFALSPGFSTIRISWRAAPFLGELTLSVNGTLRATLDMLDNNVHRVDSVRLGLIDGPAMPTSTGFIEIDDFLSWR